MSCPEVCLALLVLKEKAVKDPDVRMPQTMQDLLKVKGWEGPYGVNRIVLRERKRILRCVRRTFLLPCTVGVYLDVRRGLEAWGR